MSGEIRLAFFCQYAIVICYKRIKIVKNLNIRTMQKGNIGVTTENIFPHH